MIRQSALLIAIVLAFFALRAHAAAQEKEPSALDPFAPREKTRADAVPGYLELSDGTVRLGQIFLTRDHRLKILDAKTERQREIPLAAIRRVECKIAKEWMEKEWRFKENANDEKVFTGKSYPSREYTHVVTLNDGRKLEGPLAAIVYVQADKSPEAERFFLHKRDKGEVGTALKALVYVRSLNLGDKAVEEAKDKAAKKKDAKKNVP